ncbi:YheC/YheD family protein [Thalassobacillus sp. B23F22_16]|uniref:YheC/YheD family protein n=1 Tax=Thalassobacillus sp. B23F22_16 TaxID=3459513 RepID=UPI00373EDA20
MLVGYMRTFKKPKEFVKLLAKTTKYHGIDLVYFHPKDIDMERNVVNGKVLVDNKWVTKEVPVPPFVDVTVYSFKYKEQIKFLRKHSYFTTDRLSSKSNMYTKLKEDGEFADILIPTIEDSDFKDFYKFLKHHNQIVMKPKRGHKGQGIYKLAKEKNKYILSYGNNSEKISKGKLKKFYKKNLAPKNYIYQKYIASRTKHGDPFDCRIRLEKNGKGEWEIVINLIRIGTGQKVVSNIAQGGCISYLDPFLQANYGDQWKEIKNSINEVGKTFPAKLEKLFNKELGSLGIDLGIDENGKLYFFESNNAPGVEGAWGEIALVKSEYYNYMLNKLSGKNSENNIRTAQH